ncbi:mitochondrial protein Pet127-domain-containing protein [Phlyctochytrium arcticum]|nr:mitochondrial protein Pet127-domain-containing protein [Phlyctochytrium arcticum]
MPLRQCLCRPLAQTRRALNSSAWKEHFTLPSQKVKPSRPPIPSATKSKAQGSETSHKPGIPKSRYKASEGQQLTVKHFPKETFSPNRFVYKSLEDGILPPPLAHGLDAILFKDGPQFLQDPETKTFNYDPWLKNVLQPENFNFDALPAFNPSGTDELLRELAQKHGASFYSSTSSMTGVLSQIHMFLTNGKLLNVDSFSDDFDNEPDRFTNISRQPVSVKLSGVDTTSIDVEKSDEISEGTVMMSLGKSMEKMLTASITEFEQYHKGAMSSEETKMRSKEKEAFHFTLAEGFLLRAQLDGQDPRLPKKTFDIKTRATLLPRMDPHNYKDHVDYRIHSFYGLHNSFEREVYDMMRGAFLKFSLQARIGDMDGIFVCYHNTSEVFGFQYFPLSKIDEYLFGNSYFADRAFGLSLKVLNSVLSKIKKDLLTTQSPKCLVTVANEVGPDGKRFHFYAEPLPKGTDRSWTEPIIGRTSNASPDHSPKTIPKFQPVVRYAVSCTSFVNDVEQDGPFHLSEGDNWEVALDIEETDAGTKLLDNELSKSLRAGYIRARRRCSNLKSIQITGPGQPKSKFVDALRRKTMGTSQESSS